VLHVPGKTRTVVIQSICTLGLAGESIVISDPKSELYHYTSEFLEKLGYEVYKSAWDDNIVTDDIDIPLGTRQSNIDHAGCQYSISIHQNASGNGIKWNTGNGVEVLIHNNHAKVGDSERLAKDVLAQLSKGTKQTNRGVKENELAMCNCLALGTKASILVECAFMTNQKETETMLANPDYWDECAVEIAKGIHKYTKSV
jgi:N-acetylmuramoyl-L-alanine amidase